MSSRVPHYTGAGHAMGALAVGPLHAGVRRPRKGLAGDLVVVGLGGAMVLHLQVTTGQFVSGGCTDLAGGGEGLQIGQVIHGCACHHNQRRQVNPGNCRPTADCHGPSLKILQRGWGKHG